MAYGKLDCSHWRSLHQFVKYFQNDLNEIRGSKVVELTHFDERGASRMVDVADKEVTLRTARASAQIRLKTSTLALVRDRRMAKGDVLEVARLAGIMAAKRTGELIPLCHPLGLDSVEIDLEPVDPDMIQIEAKVKIHGRTGVEMEALTAVSVAALTIYDMCKSVDREMVIAQIQLEEKTGGRRGTFRRGDGPAHDSERGFEA
jgi:cyclic pyranopterin phosphate synthase